MEAFPNLDSGDLPSELIAMHMTPDGDEWWLAGQDGQMMTVRGKSASKSNPPKGLIHFLLLLQQNDPCMGLVFLKLARLSLKESQLWVDEQTPLCPVLNASLTFPSTR